MLGETNEVRRRPRWWLIARNGDGRAEILSVSGGDDEEALAVFSFREEAELFLAFGRLEDCWQTRESTAEELVTVLQDTCAVAGSVALDPLPEMLTETTVGRVRLGWKRFVECVLRRP